MLVYMHIMRPFRNAVNRPADRSVRLIQYTVIITVTAQCVHNYVMRIAVEVTVSSDRKSLWGQHQRLYV